MFLSLLNSVLVGGKMPESCYHLAGSIPMLIGQISMFTSETSKFRDWHATWVHLFSHMLVCWVVRLTWRVGLNQLVRFCLCRSPLFMTHSLTQIASAGG